MNSSPTSYNPFNSSRIPHNSSGVNSKKLMDEQRVYDRWAPRPAQVDPQKQALEDELGELAIAIEALAEARESAIKVANEIDTVDYDDDGTEAAYDYSCAGTPNPALERGTSVPPFYQQEYLDDDGSVTPTRVMADDNPFGFKIAQNPFATSKQTTATTGFNNARPSRIAIEQQVQSHLKKKHGGIAARAYYQPPAMAPLPAFTDPKDAKIATLEYELNYYKLAAAYERADADAQASKAESIWTEKNCVWKDASDGWKLVSMLRRKNRWLEGQLQGSRGRQIENRYGQKKPQIDNIDAQKMIRDRMERISDGTPKLRRRSASPVMQKEGEVFGARAQTCEREWDDFLT